MQKENTMCNNYSSNDIWKKIRKDIHKLLKNLLKDFWRLINKRVTRQSWLVRIKRVCLPISMTLSFHRQGVTLCSQVARTFSKLCFVEFSPLYLNQLNQKISGWRGSNSRHFAWEANILPLNYTRNSCFYYTISIKICNIIFSFLIHAAITY